MPKIILALAFFALPAFAQTSPPSATLTWMPPTTYSDGTAIPSSVSVTYNLYQGTSATSLIDVAAGVTAATSTITSGLENGQTYYWAVTAVANGLEGVRSNIVSKAFPPGPAAVVLTVK